MTTTRQVVLGVLVAVVLFVALEFVPDGDLVIMIGGALLLLVALIRGTRLPLMFRVFITACTFYWAYISCLVGRTMEPGLTGYTIGMALTVFVLYGCWPGIALFRLWRPKIAVGLLCVLLPVAFTLAAVVAGTEEYLFIRKYHDTGVGVTKRWTVSNHWLSYDKDAHRLDGSD
jgi:hypothetical protein